MVLRALTKVSKPNRINHTEVVFSGNEAATAKEAKAKKQRGEISLSHPHQSQSCGYSVYTTSLHSAIRLCTQLRE